MPKGTRKPLSDRTRFEVFKRDDFKCQYCGAAAPNVLLCVDHIKPVAEGGTSDMMNYVTACVTCNSGKGARVLSDRSAIEKQRQELEELNERRLQLEWMLEWRDGLADIQDLQISTLIEKFHELAPGWVTNEPHRRDVRKWLRKHQLSELLDAAEKAADAYLRWAPSEADPNVKVVTRESWINTFYMIPRVAAVEQAQLHEPYLKDLFSIRALLRYRVQEEYGEVPWWFSRDCMPLLKEAIAYGITPEEMRDLAKGIRGWKLFRDTLTVWINDEKKKKRST